MDDDLFRTGPVTPRERAGIFLDRLRRRIPYAAAMISYQHPRRAEQVVLVSRNYRPDVVRYMVEEFVPRDPAYRLVATHPSRVFHWGVLPSFRHGYTAREVLIPHGYQEGTSLALTDGGEVIGTAHISLRESAFAAGGLKLLPSVRSVLSEITGVHRRQVRAGLSPRETEILRLRATGLSNVQIAQRLTVSRRTVATHVEHILAKLGAQNRVQAALTAVAFGLVPCG